MKPSRSLVLLTSLLFLLTCVSAAVGVFWQTDGDAFLFTPLRGAPVEIYGSGIYAYNSTFFGAGFRGTDVITLLVALPLLAGALLAYRRRSGGGGLLLAGMFGYFLYTSASLAFGAAYDALFLLYVAAFSLSLSGLILAVTLIDVPALAANAARGLPHRAVGGFLIVMGGLVGAVWLGDILAALAENRVVAEVGANTTVVTYVLDLGVILPVCVVAGVLLMRRVAAGYVLALLTLPLAVLIGPVVIGQTVVQALSGVVVPPGALIGKGVSFVVMSAGAAWCLVQLLRAGSGVRVVPPADTVRVGTT